MVGLIAKFQISLARAELSLLLAHPVAGGIEGVMRSFPITACASALACFAAVLLMSNGAAAQGSAQDRGLIATYNASGQQLFKQFSEKSGNIVFSPYSIGAAMAMAVSGARGETEAEMAGVLRHHQDRAQIDNANARVLAKLNGYAVPPCPADLKLIDDECRTPLPPSGVCPSGSEREGDLCVAPRTLASAKLLVANALMAVLPLIAKEYAETLKEKYAAEVFQGAKLEDVNGWVKRKTEDKIDKILARLDPRDVAVLLNAIYFKARWQDVFEPRATQEATFSLTNSQRIKVPMMQRIGYYYVVQRRGYRAIRLPYSVREIGMIVVVPDEVDGLKKVGNRLGAQELSEMFRAVQEEEKRIDLMMPRFKTTYDAGLKQPFKDLGMRMAFNSKQADFSGMTGRPPSDPRLFISEIIHRAVIDVTEEGTEAAAATAVIMRKGTGRAAPPEPFHIDRPFLYYIVDDATGAILFQGRIVDPR